MTAPEYHDRLLKLQEELLVEPPAGVALLETLQMAIDCARRAVKQAECKHDGRYRERRAGCVVYRACWHCGLELPPLEGSVP